MNARTWGSDPFAVTALDPREIGATIDALDAVAAGERDAPPVRGVMGQLVVERAPLTP